MPDTIAYDVTTNATFNGSVDICFLAPDTVNAARLSRLRVLHGEGDTLVDRTTNRSAPPRFVCSTVTSFSPFVLAEVGADTTPHIEGRVREASGAPLANLTITLTGTPEARTVQTDANGDFRFTGLQDTGANYTVTPAPAGRTFAPASLNFTNLSDDHTANFTATQRKGRRSFGTRNRR